MHVCRLDVTSRKDVRRFVDLPFRLYRNCAIWVPPVIPQILMDLDFGHHPFYEHSEAAFFVAFQGTELVGRTAVLENIRYNAHHDSRDAFFYHFDCVDDVEVSRGLLDAACDWALKQNLDRIWGPKGFMTTDGQGILVEGFEHRPAMGIPYNYPYYSSLLEDSGFGKKLDLISWYMSRETPPPDRFLHIADQIKRRRGFRTVVFGSKAELRALVPQILFVYNQTFRDVQGYVPITDCEAQAIADRMLTVVDPSLVSLLMKEDELIGFVLAYPDLSEALQRCRGQLWPTGWFHLWRESRKTEWVNLNGAGILESYRGLGGNALLYAELCHVLVNNPQYQHADLVQTQETNAGILQEMGMLGVRPYKRHRHFERVLK